jgi:electron-transferring-flavoprotein dehydrogenase
MGEQAAELGVDVLTGTPGAELVFGSDGSVNGIVSGDFGVSRAGRRKENYQAGVEIRAKQTVLAEGARGSLTEKVIEKYKLRSESDPPTYGIGLKEVWEVDN